MVWVMCQKRGSKTFQDGELDQIDGFIKDCDCDNCSSAKIQNESYREFVEARERKLLYGWYEPLKD